MKTFYKVLRFGKCKDVCDLCSLFQFEIIWAQLTGCLTWKQTLTVVSQSYLSCGLFWESGRYFSDLKKYSTALSKSVVGEWLAWGVNCDFVFVSCAVAKRYLCVWKICHLAMYLWGQDVHAFAQGQFQVFFFIFMWQWLYRGCYNGITQAHKLKTNMFFRPT